MALEYRIGAVSRLLGLLRLQLGLQLYKMSEMTSSLVSDSSQSSPLISEDSSSPVKENRKRTHGGNNNHEVKRQCIEVDKIKRRKVALLMAYSGQGYLGMQRNPGMKTIEEDLLSAMLKAGLISQDAYNLPQAIQFQRAARTDKGVSAARQIVSLKMPTEGRVIENINLHLPEQIRVFGLKRVTKGFNSKSSCDARTYSYMLPTFAFTPSLETLNEDYRVTDEVLRGVNETLKAFEGTHNFHNFTARKKCGDPSATRYILNIESGDPFMLGEMEFITIKVKGQSFMLHQIRKMVGMVIAVARGLTTRDTILKAWKVDRLDIPVAPGLGLVLEEVHYDMYNRRYGSDGIHDPLDWTDEDENVKKFKEEFIYPTIVETEKTEKSMLNWLLTLPFHSYDVREREESAIHGLAALERAALVVEEEDSSHGLTTLATAAQVILEEQDRQCSSSKTSWSEDSTSDLTSCEASQSTSKSSDVVCNGSQGLLVENKD